MRRALLGAGAGVVLAVLVSTVLAPYTRFLVGELAAVVIVTLGLNLLMGVAGLLTLASAAFVGIGANLMVIFMVRAAVPVALAVVAAVCAGWCVGWALGLVSLRLRGFYLAIVTYGFVELVITLLVSGGDLTGGGYGLVVPPASLPFVGALTVDDYAAAAVFTAVLVIALLRNVIASRVGRALAAIKDNPGAADLQGIDIARMRTLAFAASSALACLGGAFQALLLGVTHPDAYGVLVSVDHITYAVVGGMTSAVGGPVTGSGLLFLGPELLRQTGEWSRIGYGVLLLLVLIIAPTGLAGLVSVSWRRIRRTSLGRAVRHVRLREAAR